MRPGEKMHCRESRKCFLAKKRIVGSPESASRRKNALSGVPKVLLGEKTHRREARKYFLAEKRAVGNGFSAFSRKETRPPDFLCTFAGKRNTLFITKNTSSYE